LGQKVSKGTQGNVQPRTGKGGAHRRLEHLYVIEDEREGKKVVKWLRKGRGKSSRSEKRALSSAHRGRFPTLRRKKPAHH